MPDPVSSILVLVALSALVVPLVFLVVFVGGYRRRRAGVELGPRWPSSVAFLGGASLGTMFLMIDDYVLGAPFVIVALIVVVAQCRSGQRSLAGLVLAGATLPWTLLWGAYLAVHVSEFRLHDPAEGTLAFLGGALLTALGLGIVLRDRQATVATAGRDPAQRPPLRTFNTVGQAMRAPSRVGPVGAPELAALVVLVIGGLALTALAAFGVPAIVAYVADVLVTSAVATEAYLRAMAPRTRRSMEAFMWLGSWEFDQVRAATGERVPITRAGAAQWLARHPPSPSDPPHVKGLRVDLNLLAGRVADARAAVEELPEGGPLDRFHKAAAADLVAWWTSQGDALEAMADATSDVIPADGDDRLRAEVGLAVARVRHLTVGDPIVPTPSDGDPLQPLLDARVRLGAKADGQVRRILWPRLYRVLVVASILFAIVGAATGMSAPLW